VVVFLLIIKKGICLTKYINFYLLAEVLRTVTNLWIVLIPILSVITFSIFKPYSLADV